ncbi:pyridoxal-phosphate dependent enzyme [Luteipulveratus halotolerans]|uniref:Cysteine synthase n=1 Tax=Luteipulveratus halotolerans TaxID=1631356 RepID=A0A0L6CMF0_9MICO|nr:pyridoxal-phosphate dependent enzyme [Luteipulveratus halotolerans]KNX38922.1 cysteine synthase [Luteipulveratus halotolerans]
MDVLLHAGEAIGRPDLIALGTGTYALRFESMKVLSARAALQHLIDEGRLRPGDTVIDSSSGIYAQALALACHELEIRCRIIGSTTIDPVQRAQLELLGVDLEQMPATDSLRQDQDRRVARIRAILDAEPGVHWMRQYHDAVHDHGYRPVGCAVAEALTSRGHDRVQLVAAVGSGVSSFAVRQEISRVLPCDLVGVQPFGSVTFGSDHVDDPDMLIAGIGSSIPFGNVRHAAYDVVHWVSYDVARSGAVDLLRRHAVFAGLSSGAVHAVARSERPSYAGAQVLIVPDTGHRYADVVHARHRDVRPLEEHAPCTVGELAELALPWSRMEWRGRAAPRQASYDRG